MQCFEYHDCDGLLVQISLLTVLGWHGATPVLHSCKMAEAGQESERTVTLQKKACGRKDSPGQSKICRGNFENHHSNIMFCFALRLQFSISFLTFLAHYFRYSGSILVFPRQYFKYRTSVTLRVQMELFFIICTELLYIRHRPY